MRTEYGGVDDGGGRRQEIVAERRIERIATRSPDSRNYWLSRPAFGTHVIPLGLNFPNPRP